jgi:hypothetical protein
MAAVPFDREAWRAEAGVPADWGESGYSILERTRRAHTRHQWIWGGCPAGRRTVLPSKRGPRFPCAWCPIRNPGTIAALIGDHLRQIAPKTVTVEVRNLAGGDAAIVRRNSPAMIAAIEAYRRVFGRAPVLMREGGSIPVVATFQKVLGLETVLMGFGLPDDRPHSPNEKFHVPNYYRGIETWCTFWTCYERFPASRAPGRISGSRLAFNQYRDIDPDLDRDDGAAMRATTCAPTGRLCGRTVRSGGRGRATPAAAFRNSIHLRGMITSPTGLWPGQRGGPGAQQRRSPWLERSASIVWAALERRTDCLLWNAFPWHPLGPAGPLSNSRPG